MMMSGRLPNFLVIGAMKAGTGSLALYLRSHPDIYMPAVKELWFFNDRSNPNKDLDWYRNQFAGARGEKAVGEATPTYAAYPLWKGVAEGVATVLPGARLIYLIREPVARIRSHYVMMLRSGRQVLPIDEAVERDPRFIQHSQYAMQIERYLRFYPRESILLVLSEDLKTKRKETMARIFSFLQVDPDWEHRAFGRELNTTVEGAEKNFMSLIRRKMARNKEMERLPTYRMMVRMTRSVINRTRTRGIRSAEVVVSPETREFIHSQLRGDIKELRRLMPPDFDGWGIA
jgi:hypothetical protein